MTYAVAHKAIRRRFETEWGSTSSVQWPNKKFIIPEITWVRFTIVDSASNWASMGDPDNNVQRNLGQVIVNIFTLKGEGEGESTELADKVKDVFRSWNDSESGVRFVVPPYARQVKGADKKWYQVNVVAPFRFDDFT